MLQLDCTPARSGLYSAPLNVPFLPVRHLGVCRAYGIESENAAARVQIFDDLPADSGSIGPEVAEIWTAQMDLQPILHKSDRLPG